VDSPELARQVIEYMDEGVRPENAYRVLLDEDSRIHGSTEIDGSERRYYNEPESTFWQRFISGFIMILPVEEQL
jgi:putative cardiolipin synthase